MNKKIGTILMTLPAVLLLAACSFQLPWAKTSSSAQSQLQNPAMNFASQPVESKLALGTLKLEGTDLAITAEQAKTLLPLWQAVKSLGASSNTTSDEMTALYQQIEAAMTAGQVQEIQDLDLSQADFQALTQQYGVQFPQGGPNAGAGASGTQSGNQSSGGNAGDPGGGPGGFPGAGGPPPDMGGGIPGGAPSGGNSSSSQAQRTPQAGAANRGPRGGGMNVMLADALIKLLEQRAGA